MVEVGSQKVGSSDYKSLGSNQYPSGRSAKVSIGITVERSSPIASGFGKEDAYAQHFAVKHMACKGQTVDDKIISGIPVNLEIKEGDHKGEKNSDWVSSRISCPGTSSVDACRLYANHVPALQSVECTDKNLDGFVYEKKREKDGDIERDRGLAFASTQEINIINQDIGKKEPGEVESTGGLKMKLWEILGGVPSQNERMMDYPELQENIKNASVDHNRISAKGRAAGPILSSDPIETDSESPNQTIRRPATRSMARKKCLSKAVQRSRGDQNNLKMPLSSSISHQKHKGKENLRESAEEEKNSLDHNKRMLKQNASDPPHEMRRANIEFKRMGRSGSDHQNSLIKNLKKDENNIFTFDEVEGNKYNLQKNSSSHSKGPDESRKATVELGKIDYASRYNSTSYLQMRNERLLSFISTAKEPSHSDKENSPCLPCPIGKHTLQTKTEVPSDNQHSKGNVPSTIPIHKTEIDENTHTAPLKMEKGPWENVSSSSMLKYIFKHDKEAYLRMTSEADPSENLQSPTLAWNDTPITTLNKVSSSPLPIRNMNFMWKFRESDIMDNTKPGSSGSESKKDYSDDTREVDELREAESSFLGEKETKELSLASTARQDSKSTGEILETKGNEEINDLNEASGHDIHDGLARLVNQLAMALRRFKSKIQSHTNRKSCEILAVVADKIKLHLQDVESQIKTEMGQSTGTIKSKRKRLESRFVDQQERLRLIYEKFQEEVNLHLLNCRTTIEELEAQSIDMKGTADKQKASHRKLLLHVEEAVKDQLTAAETSIAAVRKESRKKMNSLKFSLKMWLDEGAVC